MRIYKRIKSDVAFVTLHGRLMGGGELEKLDKVLTELNNNGVDECVVDFRNISFVNSSGAGFLINKKNSFEQSGKGFRIVNPNGSVRSYFELTKLSNFLQ